MAVERVARGEGQRVDRDLRAEARVQGGGLRDVEAVRQRDEPRGAEARALEVRGLGVDAAPELDEDVREAQPEDARRPARRGSPKCGR